MTEKTISFDGVALLMTEFRLLTDMALMASNDNTYGIIFIFVDGTAVVLRISADTRDGGLELMIKAEGSNDEFFL
jgi:hypothetical protein